MSLKGKIAKRQLKAMGIDLSNPESLTFKTIKDLISSSVPSLISASSMKIFLHNQIDELENEYGV